MSNFIDAVMVMLNPLRAGTADFIDAKFAQYIRPVLNGQGLPGYAGAPARLSASSLAGMRCSRRWGCAAGTLSANQPTWLSTTLPRLVLCYAIFRGFVAMTTRVDSMMAFFIGFFLRRRENIAPPPQGRDI